MTTQATTQAKDQMTQDVKFLHPEDSLQTAYDWMDMYCFRHLPVVEAGKLIGILSDRDILRCARELEPGGELVIPEVPVRQVMSDCVITCLPTSTVAEVADLMLLLTIDAVPVADAHGKLLGMITSTDLLAMMARSQEPFAVQPIPFRLPAGTGGAPDLEAEP